MGRTFYLKAVCLGMSLTMAPVSFAQDAAVSVSITNQFYAAIAPGQDVGSMQSAVGNLLSDDAVFEIKDLEINQSKAEFIGSLDEWSDAISGGFIAHKIVDTSGDTVSASVCYGFGNSQLMTRETMRIVAGQIADVVQNQIAESCAQF